MKAKFLLLVGLFLFSLPALAHPSISIVVDSQGNIFYSDLERVWMIRPDGTMIVAVDNVHTHELWIDQNDILYGEDVTNVGDNYRHRIWKRNPNGQIENELDWRSGHPDDYNDYGFAHDASGLMYVLNRAKKRVDVMSKKKVVRSIPFDAYKGYIHWLTVRPDGTLFVTIGDSLIRVNPGDSEGTVVTEGLIERTETFDFLHDRHALMGLWTDSEENAYVSVFSGQVVKKVAPDGSTKVAFQQTGEWSIVGGTIDNEGRTLLLEFSSNNQTRVRRIDKNGEVIYG